MKIYKFNIGLLLCSSLLISIQRVSAQKDNKKRVETIESIVKNQNGTPIPNAVIYGSEGVVTAHTDENGRFKINVPPATDLRIDAKGYNSEIIPTSNGAEDIILTESPFLQGEKDIVNVPFGQTTTGDIVNSTIVLNPEDFANYDQQISVYDALLGRVPGLIGEDNIRGTGNALFVIDGVPRSPLYINLTEVKQITILKDVNASVLYGTQAKNGVIMITTKRGEALKRNINVRINQKISTPISKPKYLNSVDYMTLYDEARRNDGLSPIYENELNGYKTGNQYRYPDMDYMSSDLLKKFMSTTDVNTEFSGGNKRTRYYTNLGIISSNSLYKQEGSKHFGNNRFNVRGNVDFDITDYIHSYIDAAFILDINTNANGNLWKYSSEYHPNYYSPLLPISMIADPSLYETAKLINGSYILGGTNQYKNNIYGDYILGGYTQYYQRMAQFKVGFDVDLNQWVKGLTFNAAIGFDFFNVYDQTVKNAYAVYAPVWNETNDAIIKLEKIGEDKTDGVQKINSQSFNRNLLLNLGFNYQKSFEGGHNFLARLIGYYNKSEQNNVLLSDKYAHLGFQVTYDYQKKYLLDFSSAMTNSIKLSAAKRIGYSPTLGIGWIASNEDFWNKESVIDYLKLKVSGGILRTDNFFKYNLYKESYNVGNIFHWNDLDMDGTRGNATDLYVAGNEKLGYETMRNINMNAETYMYDRSLFLSAGFFYTEHGNQVTKREYYYPSLIGSFYPYENYGKTSYSGLEVAANWSKRWHDFSFDIGAQFTYATSKILEKDEIWNNAYQYRKDKAADAIFGLESLGFFNNKEEIGRIEQKFGTVLPGDIIYKDQNGDKVIDSNDEIQIGNTVPRYVYGLNFNLKYKNFDLFVLGQGAAKYNGIYNTPYDWIDGDKKYSVLALNRWTEETARTATYPRLSSQENSNNNRTSTFWMYNASYFSLSRVQLTYKFSQSLLNPTFIKNLSVYLNGSNLLMLCENQERRQMNIGSGPQYRNVSLGLQIGF